MVVGAKGPFLMRCSGWKLKLGIILFLVGQLFSIVHASEHGSETHEHDGALCLATLNEEQGELACEVNPAKAFLIVSGLNLAENTRQALSKL